MATLIFISKIWVLIETLSLLYESLRIFLFYSEHKNIIKIRQKLCFLIFSNRTSSYFRGKIVQKLLSLVDNITYFVEGLRNNHNNLI